MHDSFIIGSGIAGLTAASELASAGRSVLVVDKGRSIGGRMATRVTRAGWRFDHGCPSIDPEEPAFQSLLDHAGCLDGSDGMVAVPGMSSLATWLGRGLSIRQGVEVSKLSQTKKGWVAETADGGIEARHVVLTVPAPQAQALLAETPLADKIEWVTMASCLTTMAVFERFEDGAPGVMRNPTPALSQVIPDGSKPGRPHAGTYVAHASADWTAAHLELSKDEIAKLMLVELAGVLEVRPDDALYVAGHRWRYARTATPLGRPCLHDGSLAVAGDWCLGPNAEHAWASGRAAAQAILSD